MTTKKQLSVQALYNNLNAGGVDYFCGVPDSITGPFSSFLEDHAKDKHTITANEGNAIGLAIGYHIATGKIPLVYMQNSGLNNSIDPLASLADRSILNTPMLLLIGWRGQPGRNDEPHHARQGAITPDLLRSLEIPFDTLSHDTAETSQQIKEIIKNVNDLNRPHALLIEQDNFARYTPNSKPPNNYPMNREEALAIVVEALDKDAIIVAGIGKLGRELFEYRQKHGRNHKKDLLVVGGMGHASSIALGIAQQKPEKKVFCLDGDGSTLMHLGALPTIGDLGPTNFYHVIFNNKSHDSVGGQPTAVRNIKMSEIARACGYRYTTSQSDAELVSAETVRIQQADGPALLEIKIRPGARSDLTRPTIKPFINKQEFMSFLKQL